MSVLPDFLARIPLPLRQSGFWLLWAISTTLMLLPASELPTVNLWDKAEHAMTFAALMALAWPAYHHRFSAQKLALSLVGYGIAIECIQFFIPSRSFSVLDMVADSIGVAVVLLFLRRVQIP